MEAAVEEETVERIRVTAPSAPSMSLAEWDGHPTAADIERTIRVLQAIGINRSLVMSDEIARLTAQTGSAAAIQRLEQRMSDDQIHFEYVVELLRLC